MLGGDLEMASSKAAEPSGKTMASSLTRKKQLTAPRDIRAM